LVLSISAKCCRFVSELNVSQKKIITKFCSELKKKAKGDFKCLKSITVCHSHVSCCFLTCTLVHVAVFLLSTSYFWKHGVFQVSLFKQCEAFFRHQACCHPDPLCGVEAAQVGTQRKGTRCQALSEDE